MDLTKEQQEALTGIVSWVKSDSYPIAILSGKAGSGKTTLIKHIVSELKKEKKSFSLFAPTGRASRIIEKIVGVEAETIHKGIYTHDKTTIDEDSELEFDGFKVKYKLKNSDLNINLLIIDESSMISDHPNRSSALSFGSDRLLHDLLHYTKILLKDRRIKRKILFVGDTAQLPPIGDDVSPALSEKYFFDNYRVECKKFNLNEVVRQNQNNPILHNAEKIRNSIENKNYNQFKITGDSNVVRSINPVQAVKEFFNNQDIGSSVIITYMNSTANRYNKSIRKKIYGSSNLPVQKGDIILVTKNTSSFSNGDLLRVIESKANNEEKVIDLKVKESRNLTKKKQITLCYRDVVVRPIEATDETKDQHCKILENLLESSEGRLSSEENRSMVAEFCMRNQDIKSDTEIFNEHLKKDPYFNALVVKYGYAITCHKAQGGEWDNVIIDFDRVRKNLAFFRWSYTAVTRAKKSLSVIKPPCFGDSAVFENDEENIFHEIKE